MLKNIYFIEILSKIINKESINLIRRGKIYLLKKDGNGEQYQQPAISTCV